MAFIEDLSMVKGFAEEGIAFGVTSLRILRAPCQELDGDRTQYVGRVYK